MVIIYEIIYFLLYHSILASIVDTLETPDDLFNDVANKILPEQQPTDKIQHVLPEQLQSMDNETYVKIWFDQIDVGASNTTAVVREVSAPGIKYYIGLYFIIETPLNSSRVINFLHPHIRVMNRFLSKFKTLTYIAGVAHVPPLPPYLYDISETNFRAGIASKLEDMMKNHIFRAVLAVFVFINKPESLAAVGTEVCTGAIMYWDYALNPAENQLDNLLVLEILIILGACAEPCKDGGCESLFLPSANLSKDEIQCMTKSIETNEVSCTKEPVKDVFVPVCGNGIIENSESCDCLHPLECGSKCDANCNLRKSSRRGPSQYFIISISSVIVILIILALSTFIYLHFKQGNGVKSQSSVISIPHVGSKTEFNIPVQCKLKDWTLTCTVGEVTMYNPSKSKFDLGARRISSKASSISQTSVLSKEIFIPKTIFSTKITKNKSMVDLSKSIQLQETLRSIAKSVGKSVGKARSISPKTVSSKSLAKSKTPKNDLKRISFK